MLGGQGISRCRGHGPAPCWSRWETLSAGRQAVNRSHAKIRALAEQAIATLKSCRLLRKLRCSTTRLTSLVQAVLTLVIVTHETPVMITKPVPAPLSAPHAKDPYNHGT